MVTKTCLPSNLCDISHSSDNSDSCYSSDSNDSIDSSDSSDQKTFFPPFLFSKYYFSHFFCIFFLSKNISPITSKLKLWWNLKTQIVMKLKNSNDETQKLKLW